jgi:hypothetical protein
MTRILIAVATWAAVFCLEASPSQAQYHGDGRWCAVINIGFGDVSWECYYRTVEECVPNVLAGNRGFCELNPYNEPTTAAAPPPHRAHHHVHQH